jgi:hypothetical protein
MDYLGNQLSVTIEELSTGPQARWLERIPGRQPDHPLTTDLIKSNVNATPLKAHSHRVDSQSSDDLNEESRKPIRYSECRQRTPYAIADLIPNGQLQCEQLFLGSHQQPFAASRPFSVPNHAWWSRPYGRN